MKIKYLFLTIAALLSFMASASSNCNPASGYVDEMATCQKQEFDQAKQTYELLFKAIKKSKPLPKEISAALNEEHQNLSRYVDANCIALTEYGLPGAGRESVLHYLGCMTQAYKEKIKLYQYMICPAAYFEGSDPNECDEVKAIEKRK